MQTRNYTQLTSYPDQMVIIKKMKTDTIGYRRKKNPYPLLNGSDPIPDVALRLTNKVFLVPIYSSK